MTKAEIMDTKRRLGIIVNPIAGMGGKVGLKGTDNPQIVREARQLGAVPEAPRRTVETLKRIAAILADRIDVVSPPYEMGDDEAREAGFRPTVISSATRGTTTPHDTERAAKEMADLNVDLLLFAGGDGTARNIHDAIGDRIPVVGIPAGVKMHSAVYATNPRAAADLVVRYFQGEALRLREVEVMDIDEEAFRQGAVSAKLYGYLRVPYEESLVQGVKTGGFGADESALDGIASDVAERMRDSWLYVVGPGTTTRAIANKLGLRKTLLGVDVIRQGKPVGVDVTERQILRLIEGKKAKIVVTPIGGQGHIFGRGNQQISAEVIRRVGRDNIILIATPGKLAALRGKPLLVDTGDWHVDTLLSGHMRVVTGYRTEAVCRVSA